MKILKSNLILFSVFTAVLLSCGHSEDPENTHTGTEIVKKSKGPLEVESWVSGETISLADTVDMKIKLKISREYTPEIKADVLLNNDSFMLRDADEDLRSDTEFVYHDITYTFEPYFSGKFDIPSLKVEFSKDGDETVHNLSLDPVTITVTGLSEEQKDNLEIADITGPVELPSESVNPWIIFSIAGILLLGSIISGVIMRKSKIAASSERSPYEIALQALKELGEKTYIEEGQFEEFYYEITMIVRVFISAQFGIHAPESTTEEFLADMEGNPGFPSEYKPKFKEYLDHCDMVKYAAAIPGTEEIQNIFNITRDFILEAGKPTA